jgi:3-oxoadipate enol-lactonase
VKVHHRFDGPDDAPVLLLSNSLGAPLAMWDDLVPKFSESFRVLRYDPRGHGETPAPDGPYSMEDLARDTVELLDDAGVERASFCGVSLGGMMGMWLGIDAPERIDRMVLCCTSAHMPPPDMWAERAGAVRAEGMEAVTESTLERWFTREVAEGTVARAREGLLSTEPEGYAACCEAIAEHDLREQIRAITTPTLVIVADDDPSTPPEQGRLVAESIPDARLRLLPDARHLVAMERPDEVAQIVLTHLAES